MAIGFLPRTSSTPFLIRQFSLNFDLKGNNSCLLRDVLQKFPHWNRTVTEPVSPLYSQPAPKKSASSRMGMNTFPS